MRDCVFGIGQNFVKKGTAIIDLGSSRGEAIHPFIEKYGAYNKYILNEVSPPMREALKKRFIDWNYSEAVIYDDTDLKKGFPKHTSSLILSVLTVQFIPIEYRQRVLQDIYDSLIDGGAFIMVEKVLGNGSFLDNIMVSQYYNLKKGNGYTQEQIERKKLSLEGVLVPVASKWNENLLKTAGFKTYDCFWRWMNFGAWVAIKK